MVTWPGVFIGGPGGDSPIRPFLRDARICEKCSAADRISRFAFATSSLRPVTTKTGSSPRTGVLMYVLVFARSALILQPETKQNLILKKSLSMSNTKKMTRYDPGAIYGLTGTTQAILTRLPEHFVWSNDLSYLNLVFSPQHLFSDRGVDFMV